MIDEAIRSPAQWYDGISAVRHAGTAFWDDEGFVVLRDHTADIRVPIGELGFGEQRQGERVYKREGLAGFRIVLPDDLPPGIERHLPTPVKYGAWIDRLGLGKAVVVFGLVSAGAVALFMTAPEWLGPRVPASWERNLGEAMIGDFGNRLCSTPEGDAALAKLLTSVDPEHRQVRAGVANIDMVNAVALPGEQVMLFDGLVQEAETPEELAGVLGHEVGHVRERHVMTALLRQFGLTILLAGANSGMSDTLFGLAAMGYSRDAEREADEFARQRMAESRISPLGAATFFERLSAEEGSAQDDFTEMTGWIASHPAPRERAEAFRAAARGKTFRQVLSPEEFQAIKSMCANDPDVEEFDIF